MIGKTFLYKAKRGETNNRLQKLYAVLVQMGWIAADTQQRDFIDLFSGEESFVRVVWLDDVNVLAELFRELVTRKRYIQLPDGYSIWVMVNARFWDHEGNKEFGNEKLGSTRAPIDSKEDIDLLVEILNPETDLDEVRERLQSQ